MPTFGKYCGYCCSLSFYYKNHFTCLVRAPPVAAGAPPARRHAGSATPATPVSKAAARPSTATCGCRAVLHVGASLAVIWLRVTSLLIPFLVDDVWFSLPGLMSLSIRVTATSP